ncbi:MAG: citryl-CoA lyase [Pseudomonadota bacterium]
MSEDKANLEKEFIHSKIWNEEPEEDNPFVAAQCFCAGYDVYNEILTRASWAEYLYLLFKLDQPEKWQATLLEKIAIAVANPGIRSHTVRAAMCAGVGGSSNASALMAALSVGAGKLEGAHDVFLMMSWWNECGEDIDKWKSHITSPPQPHRTEVWGEIEHTPGFDPNGVSCATPVKQTLKEFVKHSEGSKLKWLLKHRDELESITQIPLAMSGVIATALIDLEINPDQGEMLFLLLRLPGAAAHALEQKKHGWRKYPFFGTALKIENDPGE